MSKGKPTPPPVIYASRLQEPPSQGELDERCHKWRRRPDDVEYWRRDLLGFMENALLEITDMSGPNTAGRARKVAREALAKCDAEGWE